MYAYLICAIFIIFSYVRRSRYMISGGWCTVYLKGWLKTTKLTLPVEILVGHLADVKATWTGPDGTRPIHLILADDDKYTQVIGIPIYVPEGCSLTVCVNDKTVLYGSGPVDLDPFYDASASLQR